MNHFTIVNPEVKRDQISFGPRPHTLIGRMSVGSFSQYRYTTDTLSILNPQFTDTLSTHYLCAITKTGNTTRQIYRPTHDRHSDNTRPNLDRHSGRYVNQQLTAISADTSIDNPRKTHDPINLLWDSLLSRLQCLAICRGEMYAALLQLGRPRVLVWMVIELGPATPKS